MGTTESFKLEILLSVRIEDEGYSASLTIKDIDTTTPFVSNDVADFLRRNTVVYGFDIAKLDEVIKLLKTGPAGSTVQVARGKRMTPGKDGSEEYRFRTTLLAGTHTDSKTDYRERGLVNNVRAGQVIATIVKEIPGKPGLTVNGNRIEPPPVKCVTVCDARMNVERYCEGNIYTYVAMTAGHARKLFSEIQVTRDFVIEGDLDYTKGNIDFVGNVGITGDVKSGFSVLAAGDISIGGNVEPGAIVKAGKSIAVNGTVRCGMENGLFEAKEDISVRSLINSKVQAGRNFFLKELINDSEVYCEGVFASSWGTIIGCTIEAIGGINVNKIGKDASASKNSIYSGKSILSEELQKRCNSELASLKNELALISKKVSIEREGGPTDTDELDPTERDRLKQLGIARGKHVKQIKERMEELEKDLMYLQQRYKINTDAKMIVKGKIYPTALLSNGANELKVIDKEENGVTLDFLMEKKS